MEVSVPTTVLIAEPNEMHCDLLRRALGSARSRFRVVACASSAVEILAALHEYPTDVVLVNTNLRCGPESWMQVLPEIRETYPKTRILVLMNSQDKELVTDAFRLGAVGVFSLGSPFNLLCKAVERVAQGQIWANTEELHCVLQAFAKSPKPLNLAPTLESRLTRREAAVVRLAVEGLSNREIARQLALTEHTVKNYLFRVFDKLGVSNRVELLLSCLQADKEQYEPELSHKKWIVKDAPLHQKKREPAIVVASHSVKHRRRTAPLAS